jgi:hypothetical protein
MIQPNMRQGSIGARCRPRTFSGSRQLVLVNEFAGKQEIAGRHRARSETQQAMSQRDDVSL